MSERDRRFGIVYVHRSGAVRRGRRPSISGYVAIDGRWVHVRSTEGDHSIPMHSVVEVAYGPSGAVDVQGES